MTEEVEKITDEYSFSAAVAEREFESMLESSGVSVMDWARMGTMSEFDVYVSFRVHRSQRVEDGGEVKCRDCGDVSRDIQAEIIIEGQSYGVCTDCLDPLGNGGGDGD